MATEPEYGTVVVTKRTSSAFISEAEKQEGEHIVSSPLVRLNREWQPKDKSAQRFKDDIIKKMEQVLNNTSSGSTPGEDPGTGDPGISPDLFYDTGYFYVEANNEYFKTHNLSQIPSRLTIFYSNVLEPDPKNSAHKIHLIHAGWTRGIYLGTEQKSGISLRFTSQNDIKIVTTDKITGNGPNAPPNGHLRILMWR